MTPFRERQTLSAMKIRRECKILAGPCQQLAQCNKRLEGGLPSTTLPSQ
jgi:hypothetical protein